MPADSPPDSRRRASLALLELPPAPTRTQVVAAYRRLCQRYHPDRFANDPERMAIATELLVEINAAYAYLIAD